MSQRVTTRGRQEKVARPSPPLSAAQRSPLLTWPRLTRLLCALIGLGISVYLSVVHLTTAVKLYCAQNSVVNCESVVTSPSSVVAGIPVAFYGVIWFLVMLALLTAPSEDRTWRVARLVWAAIGALTVLYLLRTELFVIGAICIWCTAVHVLVLLIFGVTVLAPTGAAPEPA